MKEIDVEKIRGLLERIVANEDCTFAECSAREALSLLPPPCETCGGSGTTNEPNYDIGDGIERIGKFIPCPACQVPIEIDEVKTILQEDIQIHQNWANFFRQNLDQEQAEEYKNLGDEKHHLEWIEKYKKVLACLTAQAKQIERLEKFIADNEIILKSAHTDVERMSEYVAKVDGIVPLVKKLLSAFPETIPEEQEQVSFDIPAYIVEELREITKKEKGDADGSRN